MPEIEDVRETEVTDTSTVPKIGLKYPELCPKPALPLDEGSESEVEDESPIASTTEKESPPEEERSPSAAKELPDRSEESKEDEGKVPHRGEDSEDESVAPAGRRRGGLIKDMTETMKRMGENLVGTGTSSQTSKKRKNATTEKPAPKPKKPSTWSASRTQNPTDGASVHDMDPPTEGSEANAVTPARPA